MLLLQLLFGHVKFQDQSTFSLLSVDSPLEVELQAWPSSDLHKEISSCQQAEKEKQ